MMQIAKLIGKESNNIALQYIIVNVILPGFFRPKILLGSKKDPLPVILRTDHCIFMQLDRRILFIYL